MKEGQLRSLKRKDVKNFDKMHRAKYSRFSMFLKGG